MESLRRQLGRNPPELDELLSARCPDVLQDAWAMFLELHQSRGGNGFGPNPISYSEMLAWSEMTEQRPSSYEVGAIKKLDSLYLRRQAEQAAKKKPA